MIVGAAIMAAPIIIMIQDIACRVQRRVDAPSTFYMMLVWVSVNEKNGCRFHTNSNVEGAVGSQNISASPLTSHTVFRSSFSFTLYISSQTLHTGLNRISATAMDENLLAKVMAESGKWLTSPSLWFVEFWNLFKAIYYHWPWSSLEIVITVKLYVNCTNIFLNEPVFFWSSLRIWYGTTSYMCFSGVDAKQ